MNGSELFSWFDYRWSIIRELMRIGEFSRAAAMLDELRNTWPDHPRFLLMQADLATMSGDYEAAYESLETIYLNDPSSYPAIENLGRILCMLGYYHLAAGYLNPFIIRTGFVHWDAHVLLAFSLMMVGDNHGATVLLSNVLESGEENGDDNQRNATMSALQALLAVKEGDFSRARECAGDAAAMNPSAPYVAYANGIVAEKTGRPADAIRWMSRIIEDDPRFLQPRADLIRLYEESGESEKGAMLKEGLAGFFVKPRSNREIILHIRELASAGKEKEAGVWAETLPPESLSDQDKLRFCDIFLSAGMSNPARCLAREISSSPSLMNRVYIEAMAALQSGDGQQAIEHLFMANIRDRYYSLLNMFRYARIASLGDHQPDTMDPLCRAGIVLCLEGPQKAAGLFDEAYSQNGSPYCAGLAAIIHCLNGTYQEAFRYAALAESVGFDPLNLIRPVLLRYAGFLDEAREQFGAISKRSPDLEPARLMTIQTDLDCGMWGPAFEELWGKPALNPGLPGFRLNVLEANIRSGMLTDSEDITRDIIRDTPFRICDLAGCGHALILNRQFDKAIWCFAEYVRVFDLEDDDARVHLLQSLIWSGHWAEAYLQGIIAHNDGICTFAIQFLTAAAALHIGRPDLAEEMIDSIEVGIRSETILRDHLRDLAEQQLDEIPPSAFINTPAGSIAMALFGDYTGAASRLEGEIDQIPDDAGLRIAYGDCLFHQYRYPDALRQFRAAEKICNEPVARISDWIERCRNKLFFERMHPEIIDSALIPASCESPEGMAPLLYSLGKRLLKAGEDEEARIVFERIVSLPEPDEPSVILYEMKAEAFHALGDICKENSSYDTAVHLYDRAIREDTGCARFYAGKGIVLCNTGRYQEAETALREAIRLDPACGRAYSGLAWCLANTGKTQEAEYFGDRAVAFASDDWGAWNNRALARLASGNFAGAEQDFRRAVFLAPDEMIAISNLHDTLVATADDDAETIRREALLRFGDRIVTRISEAQRHAGQAGMPVFDYNRPEVW